MRRCGLVERLHARLMILKSRFNPDIRYFSSFAVLENEELLTDIASLVVNHIKTVFTICCHSSIG